jgi:hypothetical protein
VRGDKAWCERWDEYVNGAYYCNAWQPHEDDDADEQEAGYRAVDLMLPEYIMEAAAARGLEYHAAGLSGDGVVDRTIREARLMADGQVSEDKVIRTSAWAARHLVDLDAEDNRDPEAEGFPGAGAVAFYLWGIDALDPEPAIDWLLASRSRFKPRSVARLSWANRAVLRLSYDYCCRDTSNHRQRV